MGWRRREHGLLFVRTSIPRENKKKKTGKEGGRDWICSYPYQRQYRQKEGHENAQELGERERWKTGAGATLLVERGQDGNVPSKISWFRYATSSAAASITTNYERQTTAFRKDHLTGESLERQRRRAYRCTAAFFGVQKKLPHDKVEHRHDELGDVPPDIAANGARVHRYGGGAGPGGGKSPSELLHTARVIETGNERTASHRRGGEGMGGRGVDISGIRGWKHRGFRRVDVWTWCVNVSTISPDLLILWR